MRTLKRIEHQNTLRVLSDSLWTIKEGGIQPDGRTDPLKGVAGKEFLVLCISSFRNKVCFFLVYTYYIVFIWEGV